jgi:hypothetical protein
MATHELKTWPGPFQAVRDRVKRFEWRLNDRDFAVGDTLVLREWDQRARRYTGEAEAHRVTYILTEGFGIPDGYCVMSIEPLDCVRAEPAPRREGRPTCLVCGGLRFVVRETAAGFNHEPCGCTGTTEAHGTGEGT